jgi:hypothetical protein
MDAYIQFAMLTGVTKFGKVSVFSDLNNLNDISMSEQYVDICGISEQELYANFEEDIHALANKQAMSYEAACAKLKEMYNGYHFRQDSIGVYNPFSVLTTFYNMAFGSYWFATGTPSYLVELLKDSNYNLECLAHEETDAEVLDSIDPSSPIPVIYQSGYLTIKGYDEEFGLYRLGFPNREVEEGFIKFLLPFYSSVCKEEVTSIIKLFAKDIQGGNVDAFLHRLQAFFAGIPYDDMKRDLEWHYQNTAYILCSLLGFYVQKEYHTSQGRIDLQLKTDKYIYIIEFKVEGTAEEALAQINAKNYAAQYATDPTTLFKIGVNFSNETRTIERWVVE